LVAEDVADIVHEAPIPPENPIEGLSTPEATPERDLQASEIQLDAEYVADMPATHKSLRKSLFLYLK
jgi:hypothetical protein